MAEDREPVEAAGEGKSSGEQLAAELSEIAAANRDKDNSGNTAEQKEQQHNPIEIVIDKERIAADQNIPAQMKEWLLRLPDTLRFDEPVIFIVGDNGKGKTQFARAVASLLATDRQGADERTGQLLPEGKEPAEDIAKALSLAAPRTGNLVTEMIEGATLMHRTREWARQQGRQEGEPTGNSGSTRELFEEAVGSARARLDRNRTRVFRAVNEELPADHGEVVVIFDEPEMGLSPDGQERLPETLTNFLEPTDTLLVPTNNFVLAKCSDTPRLSLKYPERGVHRPSEYGELYQLTKA